MGVSEQSGLATETPSSLGQVLQNARTARALTIEQLATELRIEVQQLQALEQNQFDKIGPPVFVKGYLRHYGQRLGLEYRDLLAMYYDQAERREVVIQPSRTIKLRDERQITVWIVAAVLLALVAVALAIWWVNSGRPLSFASATDGSAPAATEPPVERATERTDRSAAPRPGETAALFAAAAAAAAPQTRAAARNMQADALPAEPLTASPAELGAADSSAAAVGVSTVQLVIDVGEESWVEVTSADGRLFVGAAGAGRRLELAGVPPIAVLLGNAIGASVTVNGAPHPISGRRGNVARFTIPAAAPIAD